jgi:Xaa-Pro aminopeptidase
MITQKEFAKRRKSLLKKMGKDSIAILNSAPQMRRNCNIDYPYRQDSDFYYFTGISEPEMLAVFIPGRKEGEYILFLPEFNFETSVWTGATLDPKRAYREFGADQVFTNNLREQELPALLLNRKKVFFNLGKNSHFENQVLKWVKISKTKIREGKNAPDTFIDLEPIIGEMRLIKSPAEIKIMKKVANLSAAAHLETMKLCRPGIMEYQLAANIWHHYLKNGASFPAFEVIVASGKNACILHYIKNDQKIKNNELVLIDSGAEYQFYSADITRTFPANGRFSSEQKAIYQAVLDTQKKVIAAIRPGISWDKLQALTEKTITKHLIKLGILKGSLAKLLQEKAFFPFFMHKFGHFLGIDNKDSGRYKIDDRWRILKPGMIFTVEPGIYIRANTPSVDKKWWNIGVRIEDNVLVTRKGVEVLTTLVPKEIKAIEALFFDRKT